MSSETQKTEDILMVQLPLKCPSLNTDHKIDCTMTPQTMQSKSKTRVLKLSEERFEIVAMWVSYPIFQLLSNCNPHFQSKQIKKARVQDFPFNHSYRQRPLSFFKFLWMDIKMPMTQTDSDRRKISKSPKHGFFRALKCSYFVLKVSHGLVTN